MVEKRGGGEGVLELFRTDGAQDSKQQTYVKAEACAVRAFCEDSSRGFSSTTIFHLPVSSLAISLSSGLGLESPGRAGVSCIVFASLILQGTDIKSGLVSFVVLDFCRRFTALFQDCLVGN